MAFNWASLGTWASAAGPSNKVMQLAMSNRNERNQKNQNWQDYIDQQKFYSLQRIHARQDYAKQRKDSISDRDYANAYNTPAQTMQRLKEAGLNPNLIYGNGASQQAAATTSSTPTRGSQGSMPNREAPKVDYGGMGVNGEAIFRILNTIASTQNLQANTDNAKTTKGLIQENIDLARQGNLGKSIENRRLSLDYRKANQLYDASIMRADLDNQKIKADIEGRKASTLFTIHADQRAALANSANIAKTMQDILTQKQAESKSVLEQDHIRELIEITKKENVIKQLEQELAKEGVFKSDPIYYRKIMEKLEAVKRSYPSRAGFPQSKPYKITK